MKKKFNKFKKILKEFILNPWLYDPNFQINNEKWRIHKVDKYKNFPSIPHMDCVTDSRKKMNIYIGEVFSKKNRKCVGKVNKKDLKRLWSDYEFRKIVYDERIRYKKYITKR